MDAVKSELRINGEVSASPEIDCGQMAMGLPPTYAVYFKSNLGKMCFGGICVMYLL
jgi:hypothetical protein